MEGFDGLSFERMNNITNNLRNVQVLFIKFFVTFDSLMETKLFKPKRGKPLDHDFSGLKVGQAVKFKGNAVKNPYPYASRWNKTNKIKIEVWRDQHGTPYAKRVK